MELQLPETILFVDDDEQVRKAFVRALRNTGFQVDPAKDAWAAMKLARRKSYAVVATDYRMPGLDGFQLRDELRSMQPEATFVLVSGNCDLPLTLDAINEHQMSYVIPKPWNINSLVSTLNRAAEEAWERMSARYLEADRVSASRSLLIQRARASEEGLTHLVGEILLDALELRSPGSRRTSMRIRRLASMLTEEMGIGGREAHDIRVAAALREIGKLGVSDVIVNKPSALTREEWEIMKTTPELAAGLIDGVPGFEQIRQILLQQHERWDGTGYPAGLSSTEICLGARVFAVVMTLDAMMSDRPYRSGAPFDVAYQEVVRAAGSQLDPEVVRAFVAIPRERWVEARSAEMIGSLFDEPSMVN